MSRLPVVDFKTMDKLLRKLGFQDKRRKGSHVFYQHPDGRTTTLPNHPGRDLATPLTRTVLREIGLSPQRFTEEIRKL